MKQTETPPKRGMRVDDLHAASVVKPLFAAVGRFSGWWVLSADIPLSDGRRSFQYLLCSMPAGSVDVPAADIETSYPGDQAGFEKAMADAERALRRELR